QRNQQFENFRISRRRFTARGRRADNLGADLIELAISSLLRTLSSKLWPDVVELVQPASLKIVLDVGTNNAGGVFGAESEGLTSVALRASLVLPCVHFFRDDVCL